MNSHENAGNSGRARAWNSGKRGKTVGMNGLQDAIRKLGASNTPEIAKALRAAQAQRVWEKVAPQEVLDHTDNVYLIRNEDTTDMVIRVDSSHWAAELSAQSEQFRREIAKELKKESIGSVQFKVDYWVKKKKEFRRYQEEPPSYIDDVESIPLSDDEQKRIEQEVDKIRNENVREALFRARIKDLEWKKGIEGSKSR